MKNRHENIKNELAYFYKVIKNMVRSVPRSVGETVALTNRKKHIDLRIKMSKATISLLLEARK